MAITVSFSGNAIPFLQRMRSRFTAKRINSMAAESVAELVTRHIANLEATRPNKMGWPRTHFWGKSSKSVTWKGDATGGQVEVAREGFRQRYYGGRIDPVNVKALTIPINPAAYGKRALKFNLRFIPHKEGTTVGFLVTRDKTPEWYYVLKSFVVQKPDKSVIPTDAQLANAALKGVTDELKEMGL